MPARRSTPSPLMRPPPDCRNFTGYKPCIPGTRCYRKCVAPSPRGRRILIVNLDAMGNVLVTTSILPPLKRKHPRSTVSWITLPGAAPLLEQNPHLDRVFEWGPESWMILRSMRFDEVLCADKSQRSGAFVMSLQARRKLGFGMDENGVIVPLNREAQENYILGLDDHLKFRVNRKPVSRLLCEQFRLRYARDPYVLRFSRDEEAFMARYGKEAGLKPEHTVVGLNTGCSDLYPNKKLTVDQHVELAGLLARIPGVRVLLLGGPEDARRNAEIARRAGSRVLSTPCTEGVRRGLCYIALADCVVTGDSFGMHAAIALGKHVLAWFGVSCPAEIDLFGRGEKFVPEGLECSPCWKRVCPTRVECRSMVDVRAVAEAVRRFDARRRAARG
ncbi:MAG: glycosyltransferase family 9 protein [Bacteroidota bacterium]